jgi:hypothetical protein
MEKIVPYLIPYKYIFYLKLFEQGKTLVDHFKFESLEDFWIKKWSCSFRVGLVAGPTFLTRLACTTIAPHQTPLLSLPTTCEPPSSGAFGSMSPTRPLPRAPPRRAPHWPAGTRPHSCFSQPRRLPSRGCCCSTLPLPSTPPRPAAILPTDAWARAHLGHVCELHQAAPAALFNPSPFPPPSASRHRHARSCCRCAWRCSSMSSSEACAAAHRLTLKLSGRAAQSPHTVSRSPSLPRSPVTELHGRATLGASVSCPVLLLSMPGHSAPCCCSAAAATLPMACPRCLFSLCAAQWE